ncbi:MAG: glutathione-independent formaldehyde dehydrogenase [Sphaerobacter sp.]|nr:glutathione-independent formaldehyde dehydrogenase [Sphaerobacter sp.]
MKAVVYKGPNKVAVEQVEDPRIQAPTDVLVRVTSTAICGSDLHMYEGRTAAQPGIVFGHENMGVVEEVGSGVATIKKGDRVVMPFNIACGFCFNCVRGYTGFCLTANPGFAGSAYGYVAMGPYPGGQAEMLRVPFADFNCLKLPGQPGDEWEDDFMMLADIFPTGYHGTELADVRPGSTVAVFGAGPVGLMATYSAMLRGAAEVYVVDRVPERLKKAEEIGATPIDFSKGDPVQQIFDARSKKPGVRGAMRPGEETMLGVMCGVDAVGYQASSHTDGSKEQPNRVLEDLIRVVNPTGRIGIPGLYVPTDPGGVDDAAKQGQLLLSFGKLFEKGIRLGTGQTNVKQYNVFLRDLIISGRAKPSFVVSHRVPLEQAPMAYEKFDKRIEGYTKVVLKPQMTAA